MSEGTQSDVANFVPVAKTSEIPPGRINVYEVDGIRIALCNVNGRFYAIDDVCTHDGGPLDQGVLEDNLVECPRHGAKFDVITGRAVVLPAVRPVRTYPLEIEGDDVKVSVD
ncbi:MAG TPA: non-heme iron oxygenase ferredoxin subunit [Dehalococcoidia bacterium]|nr:non-heme iron oxygenase ferredoxin subunit [Dehalococcoidia bacterium]